VGFVKFFGEDLRKAFVLQNSATVFLLPRHTCEFIDELKDRIRDAVMTVYQDIP